MTDNDTTTPITVADADGGPAFPIMRYGMSLRDWFAGQALVGLLASGPYDCGPEGVVGDAYLYADAMLAAREEQS